MINYDNYCKELRQISEDNFLEYRKVSEEYKADRWAVDFIKSNINILLI
jgi:hypothetical protein